MGSKSRFLTELSSKNLEMIKGILGKNDDYKNDIMYLENLDEFIEAGVLSRNENNECPCDDAVIIDYNAYLKNCFDIVRKYPKKVFICIVSVMENAIIPLEIQPADRFEYPLEKLMIIEANLGLEMGYKQKMFNTGMVDRRVASAIPPIDNIDNLVTIQGLTVAFYKTIKALTER